PTSRARPPPTGDEEATSQLRLGEFDGVDTLSVSEAYHLLNAMEQRLTADGKQIPNNDVYVKTREYLNLFARFKDLPAVQSVESYLEKLSDKLAPFEKAQLGTLCCDTAEEARTLVPSLEGKFSDDQLQQVLDDISKLRDF
ncbi:RNA polymerase II, partial [Polychaeton citri CBS 116435]